MLERDFASRPSGDWLTDLARSGVPAAEVVSLGQILEAPPEPARDLLIEHRTRSFGAIRQIGPLPRYAEAPPPPPRPAPDLGEHTDEILAQIGYSAEDISRLRADGVIR